MLQFVVVGAAAQLVHASIPPVSNGISETKNLSALQQQSISHRPSPP